MINTNMHLPQNPFCQHRLQGLKLLIHLGSACHYLEVPGQIRALSSPSRPLQVTFLFWMTVQLFRTISLCNTT
jgi:hypothetical protein